MIKASISIQFVAEAIFAAGAQGWDVPALLARAGISQELLENPQSRVSPQQYGALWHVLAQALDDEFFGMDSRPMRYGSFAILCHSLLDCRNLGHALSRAIRFFALILDDMTGELQCDGEQASIILKDGRESPRLFAHGTYFVILHGLACWLTRRRLRIAGARFCQSEPASLPEYKNIFGKHLLFEQARSSLSLEAAALDLPILRDGPAATAFLRQAPANILVKYRDCDGQVAKIRRLLAATPFEDWPDFATVAAALHTTTSKAAVPIRTWSLLSVCG